jgi:hypothetical protein
MLQDFGGRLTQEAGSKVAASMPRNHQTPDVDRDRFVGDIVGRAKMQLPCCSRSLSGQRSAKLGTPGAESGPGASRRQGFSLPIYMHGVMSALEGRCHPTMPNLFVFRTTGISRPSRTWRP